jgi:GT2 family glycosyltransferase
MSTKMTIVQITPRAMLENISVVIPTIGRPILEESLYRIALGTAWPAQIIVVDQSSNPAVASRLARLHSFGLNTEYVPSSQRGRAAGLNRGIERVTTRFVAITDDDCFVEPDWLERMHDHLKNNPGAIVTGRVHAEGDEPILVVVESSKPAVQRRPHLKFDSMCGGNMGAAIEVIKRIGTFDEDPCLRTAEDCEYSYRALRAGVPIVYAPDVVVRHLGWRDKRERIIQYKNYARSHGGFYGKHLRRGDWFIALRVLVHHLRAFRRWITGLTTGDRDLADCGRAYLTGLLPGIIAGIRANRSLC